MRQIFLIVLAFEAFVFGIITERHQWIQFTESNLQLVALAIPLLAGFFIGAWALILVAMDRKPASRKTTDNNQQKP